MNELPDKAVANDCSIIRGQLSSYKAQLLEGPPLSPFSLTTSPSPLSPPGIEIVSVRFD